MRVFGETGEPRELVRDAWDRGLVVPASAAMQWKGRSLNQPPSLLISFFQRKKQYKEIRLSDETKQLPTVPARP